jgi:choline dehydrogenase-like flavoprotein
MVDYIVVGGGSAGCVIAARLSENPQASVILLEEGPRDSHPFIHLPVGFYKTSQGNLVEHYPWEPPADYIGAANPTMVQARVLGGGSSVNAMVYLRGQPADYDSWAASGAQGWAYRPLQQRRTRHRWPARRQRSALYPPLDQALAASLPTSRAGL